IDHGFDAASALAADPDFALELSPHYERILARPAVGPIGIVSGATRNANEPFGLVQPYRRRIRRSHLEEDLLDAQSSRVLDELAQQSATQALTPGIRRDRQIENLRFARCDHQYAVSDDASFTLADPHRISGGKRIAKIEERPRRGVNLRLERCNLG